MKRKAGTGIGYGLGYSPSGKLRSGPIMTVAIAKKRRYTKGRDRVGGFYGRYSGANAELKFHDVNVDDAVVAAGGTIQNSGTVNVIVQGITESTRIGRKATVRSIHWRYKLILPEQDAVVTPATGDSLRVILYLDKQCNGATAAATDILANSAMNGFRNLQNSGRFNILLDKIHNVQYGGLASDGAAVVSQAATNHNYTFNKTCYIPLEFNGSTGAIGTIRSNNIGVMLVGDLGVIGFESKIRLRFSDQ